MTFWFSLVLIYVHIYETKYSTLFIVFIFDLFAILRWYFITENENSFFFLYSTHVLWTYIMSENKKYCIGVTSKEKRV